MDEEIDFSELWTHCENVLIRIGDPPSDSDDQYSLKLLMYETKLKILNTEKDIYRSLMYEMVAPHIELPEPSLFSLHDFLDFIELHPDYVNERTHSKHSKETRDEIREYHRKCQTMIDEIRAIEKPGIGRHMSETEAYREVTKIIDLIYECGKFIGYWTRRKELSQRAAVGPGATSAESGKWTLDKAIKVLDKYGGCQGYEALPRGKKKAVREEIEKAIKARDPRNVHNIINKIKSLQNKKK